MNRCYKTLINLIFSFSTLFIQAQSDPWVIKATQINPAEYYGITVANGIPEAKSLAVYVTKAAGGHGAVREVVRLILKAQNKWDQVVARYLAQGT